MSIPKRLEAREKHAAQGRQGLEFAPAAVYTRVMRQAPPPSHAPSDAPLPFDKMHGLGNDFVIIDARQHPVRLSPVLITALADRHRGVGFDQMAIISGGEGPPHLAFYNSDGSRSVTCGNATRCIARKLMQESGEGSVVLLSDHRRLVARDAGGEMTEVNLGPPALAWHEIPLARDLDTLHLPIAGRPTATSMGNPHCTFFVEDAESVDIAAVGRCHEHHALFPQRTNVQVVQVVGRDHLRVRVWERGVGRTLASGSSACAAAVAAARRGLCGRQQQVDLDGGSLWIHWREDGVWMRGPTAHVFSGVVTAAFLRTASAERGESGEHG